MEAWSRSTPWRQGKFLANATAAELGLTDGGPDALVIVVTHDCDLTQLPESEPTIEIVIGRQIEKESFNGNFSNAKNARKLHLPIEGANKPYLELIAARKQSIDKTSLLNQLPAPIELSEQSKTTLGRWLAKRYRRSAFPDAFETRLSSNKLDRKISDAVKNCGESIAEIYFDLRNPKAAPHENYMLDIVILYSTVNDADTARIDAEAARIKIETAFRARLYDKEQKTWKDIELGYVDVVADESLTYRHSQLLKAWRLEHISLGAEPQQPIAEE